MSKDKEGTKVDRKTTGMGKINPWKVTGYKQGQNVACRVNYAEKDGYAVTIQKDNLPGFIKTANTLKAGDEILGVFVCVHNGRILLSQLFSAPRATKHQLQQTTVNWEEHLNEDDLNAAYEAQAATSRQQRMAQFGEEPSYLPPQSPTADFSQYQPAAATSDMPPINLPGAGQQQDYSRYAPQQQQSAPPPGYDQYQQQQGQQYQSGQQHQGGDPNYQQYQAGDPNYQQYQNPQQQYDQYGQPQQVYQMPAGQQPQQHPAYDMQQQQPQQHPAYDMQQQQPQQHPAYDMQQQQPPQPPINPYQNPTQTQYNSGQQVSWDNPQGEQPSFGEAPQQNQLVPQPGYSQQLLAQQQAAQNAASGGQAPQQGAYGQPPGGPSAYGQPPGGPSGYGQPPDQQQAYQQPPQPQQQYQQEPAPGQDQQWQSPHSQVPTKKFRLRRAIDLVMPPVDQDSLESLKSFKISDYDMEWLITDLEGGMRTGCMKATSEQKLSRSAALLYKGRAVGCIYGCKASPEARPTEESLASMLSDLEAPDAVVTLYDLPEDCTLSMSALFLGYPIDNNPEMNSREYCDFVMKWFGENNSTACLAVTVEKTKSTYLVFVHKGKFTGAFFVEEQQFTREPTEIITMFNNHPEAKIEASILSADTLNSGMRFGYSLSMARQKRSGF